jgi:uncharacterized protein YjiS (DUF1127 family)
MRTQKQTNRRIGDTMEARETLYEIVQTSTGLRPREPGPRLMSLLKILHWCRTAYRLGVGRYRQRRQLMEMDDRQLKDIGITPEEAAQEARKPIWKD